MFQPNPEAPALVNELAAHVAPFGDCPVHPIAWHVGEGVVSVVFEDGRKLSFESVEAREEPTAEINLADGVNDAEAATAGRALSQRRKKGKV